MPDLVLLRHGQSCFNLEGRFTGWLDVDLSPKGSEEARRAGMLLASNGYTFDQAYASVLKRAIRTLWIVLDEMDLMWIPVCKSWRLNERNYGALQGQSKKEVEERHGPEQVRRWRRGFSERPPALEEGSTRLLIQDPRYRELSWDLFPRSESLQDTLERLLPCWHESIKADLKAGKNVLISSHGNTIRALIKQIEGISDEEIEKIEIPTAVPLVYRLDPELCLESRFYLDDAAK